MRWTLEHLSARTDVLHPSKNHRPAGNLKRQGTPSALTAGQVGESLLDTGVSRAQEEQTQYQQDVDAPVLIPKDSQGYEAVGQPLALLLLLHIIKHCL